jgi:hypothetical protein
MQLVRGLHGRGTTLGAGSGDLLRFIHSGESGLLRSWALNHCGPGLPPGHFTLAMGCAPPQALSLSLTLPLRCPLWLREFSLSLSLLAAICPISQRSRR